MNRLLHNLLSDEITIIEFVNRIETADVSEMETSIANALEARLEQRDWIALQKLFIAAKRFPSKRFTSILCKLLQLKNPELTNEDLVEALEKTNDPSCVPHLISALDYELEGDDFHAFNVKVAYALKTIGTPEAKAALLNAKKNSPFDQVRIIIAQLFNTKF